MNYLRLIIDREKYSTSFNCAIDADLVLSAVLIQAGLPASGYRDGLTKWHAHSIMHKLLRLLDGQAIRATVFDHTQSETQAYPF